jgi:hypothetical protein
MIPKLIFKLLYILSGKKITTVGITTYSQEKIKTMDKLKSHKSSSITQLIQRILSSCRNSMRVLTFALISKE